VTVRIATRRSALARAQAHQVGLRIRERAGADFELVPMATTGDRNPNRPVGDFDVKGMFVDTVREAVLAGECDVVVHSYKDLPTDPVEGLTLGAVPKRADPRDLLVTREGYAFANLPATAMIGTSSERRRIQLLKVKPALQVLPLRGNLDTRLRKVAEGELDGVVVALAGLQRLYVPEEQGGVGPLGLPLKAYALEPGECLPAAGQGALAVECRADDDDALAVCKLIDDRPTRAQVTAERAFLNALGGGCLAAVGSLCTLTGVGALDLIGLLGDPGRRRMVRLSAQGPYKDPERLGRRLAEDVRAAMEAA
jgi:hydroxymethylbilane synthase